MGLARKGMAINNGKVRRVSAVAVLISVLAAMAALGQTSSYRLSENWAQPPEGFVWGQIASVDVDRDGNVYVFQRCSADTCIGHGGPPLLKFDAGGRYLWSWGGGQIVWPHGMNIDGDGNIWLTDGQEHEGAGQQLIKLGPDGRVRLRIGEAGVAGDGPNTFNGIADVEIADNGDIFVADGHVNSRIVKFSSDGAYMKAWGVKGDGIGEFNMPHALAMDSRGRLFVADRDNYRIQIFDQDGTLIDIWKQFGRPSGIYIDDQDTLYVASQNTRVNANMVRGLYVGSAVDGTVESIIPGFNAESIAAGPDGAIYSGQRAREADPQSLDALQKFVPVR